MKPFLTDPEIIARLEAVEARLRAAIRAGQDRPFVEIGHAADDLYRLAADLKPETER